MIKKSPENNQNTLLTQVQKNGVFLKIENNTKGKVQDVMENNERNEIVKYCNTPLNFTRICLFRHLPYLEDANCKDYEELRKQLIKPGNTVNLEEFGKLDDNLEIDTNKANTGLFDSVFEDTNNTILIQNPKHTSKKRIQQTIEYIQSKYQGLEYKERNIVGSQKGTYSKQMSLIKTGEELVQIIDEIKQDITLYAGKNVVILGSRSHSHFLNPEKFDKTGKDDSEKEFEEKGYDFIDIDIHSKQIFSIDQLIISPENYQEIKKIFQLEKDNISLLNLQNGLNRFFYEHPEKYEIYIYSKSLDLRVFCIVNLIKNGNSNFIFEKLETIFQQENHENKIKISKIILDTCSDGDKKHMLDYIAQIPNLVSEMKLGNLAYYANYQKYVKNNIEYIRNKTLDERFKSGENNIISLQFNDEKIKSIDDIIQQNELIIIEGESGTGKSIKLFEIMEYLKPIEDKKNKYFPIYLNLGKISFDEIPGELERQCTGLFRNGKYIFLYLFDALDESKYDNETKKEFLKYIRKLQEEGGKVILTSRPGSKPKYKETEKKEEKIYDSIKKIGLKKFSIEDIKNYIKTHLSEEKIEIWNHWVNKNTFIDDLKDSPLMLCIICNLIEFGVDTPIINHEVQSLTSGM